MSGRDVEWVAKPQWFRSTDPEHDGQWRLAGWMLSAFETASGPVGYATCPRCFAWIGIDGAYGDRRWAHDQWHAATDYPVPAELASEVSP